MTAAPPASAAATAVAPPAIPKVAKVPIPCCVLEATEAAAVPPNPSLSKRLGDSYCCLLSKTTVSGTYKDIALATLVVLRVNPSNPCFVFLYLGVSPETISLVAGGSPGLSPTVKSLLDS